MEWDSLLYLPLKCKHLKARGPTVSNAVLIAHRSTWTLQLVAITFFNIWVSEWATKKGQLFLSSLGRNSSLCWVSDLCHFDINANMQWLNNKVYQIHSYYSTTLSNIWALPWSRRQIQNGHYYHFPFADEKTKKQNLFPANHFSYIGDETEPSFLQFISVIQTLGLPLFSSL